MKRGWLLLAVILLGAPLVVQGPFYQRMITLVLLSAISASAWNLVGGYALQISIGHAVFFGIGAYTPLVFYQHWGYVPLAGIPVGLLISVAVAVVIGTPTFRLQGHYFAMATIAVAELVRIVVTNWKFVGGAVGQMGPAVPRTVWDLTFRSSLPYYYIYLGVLAVLLGLTYWISRGRMGYYLRAIGADEREVKRKSAALADRAGRFELPVHQMNQPPRDGKAEPGTTELALDGAIGLGKRFEELGQLVRRDADPCVPHRNLPRFGFAAVLANARTELDLALLGELHRIAHQVRDHLTQSHLVADEQLGNGRVDVEQQLHGLGGDHGRKHLVHRVE